MKFTNSKYYEILGVNQNSSLDEINAAKNKIKFEKIMSFFEWKLIDEAYNVLSNPIKRQEYDEFLKKQNSVKNSKVRDVDNTDLLIMPDNNTKEKSKFFSPVVRFFQRNKTKLQNESKVKNIIQIETYDLNFIKEYENNLQKEINKLLSSPNSQYRLEIIRKNYEIKINLLKKRLELVSSRRLNSSFDVLKNKLEIMTIVKQLRSSEKKLGYIVEMIKKYSSRILALTEINQEIIERSIKL